MIHLKGPGEVLFPTNAYLSTTVKDKQAQTTRKLTEEINLSCYKIVTSSFIYLYAVFVVLKMISGSNTPQTTLEIIKEKVLVLHSLLLLEKQT